jgi:hypothetical protein
MHLFTILSINYEKRVTEWQCKDPFKLVKDIAALDKVSLNNFQMSVKKEERS